MIFRTFGNNNSLNQRQQLRLQESFETLAECKRRSLKELEELEEGKKRPHNHTGNINKWDLSQCLREVAALPDGAYLNFSQLARQHGIISANGDPLKNGGQIVKDTLVNNGIDLERFEYLGKSTELRIRRKKIRLTEGITMPCEPTNKQVIEELKKKVADGIYTMGEEIVPQTFQKYAIKDGKTLHYN